MRDHWSVCVCASCLWVCVSLTGVCAVSCVSRQTPRPERQHTHFEIVEGCAHPLQKDLPSSYKVLEVSGNVVLAVINCCSGEWFWKTTSAACHWEWGNVMWWIMTEYTMTTSTYTISQMSTAVQAKGFVFKTKSQHPVRQRDRKMKTFKSHMYISYLQKLLGDWWHGGDKNIDRLQTVEKIYIILMLWRRKSPD